MHYSLDISEFIVHWFLQLRKKPT